MRVLTIDRGIVDGIMTHARRDHPEEACGVVAGPIGSDRPQRLIPMDNAERSMTFYRFDAMEQLRVWREMEHRDEEPVVIYHSHTATEPYPSRTDISFAGEPGAHYVLVSTREPKVDEIRSFRIVDGEVTEEPVRVIGASVDGGPSGSPDAVTTYMFGQTQNNVDYECPA
jgi:proteasome lid subunit RPN8/RPN11